MFLTDSEQILVGHPVPKSLPYVRIDGAEELTRPGARAQLRAESRWAFGRARAPAATNRLLTVHRSCFA